MKKKLMLLMLFSIFLILTIKINVKAYSLGDYFTISDPGNATVTSTVSYKGSPNGFPIFTYVATSYGKGISYQAYCLDPGSNGIASGDVYISTILSEKSSEARINAWHKGLLFILKHGYRYGHDSETEDMWSSKTHSWGPVTISNNTKYGVNTGQYFAATSIALRTFTMAMLQGHGNSHQSYINVAGATSAIFWAGYSSFYEGEEATYFNDWYNAVYGIDPPETYKNTEEDNMKMARQVVGPKIYGYLGWSSYISNIKYEELNYRYIMTETNADVYDYAYYLFTNAILEAEKSYTDSDSPTGTNIIQLLSKGNFTTKNETLSSDDIYAVDITNLDQSKVHIKNIALSSDYLKYLTLSYSTDDDFSNDSKYKTLPSTLDIMSLKNATNKVYIKIHSDIPENIISDNCTPGKYTINYKYDGLKESSNGYIVAVLPGNEAQTVSTQRYAFYVDDEGESSSIGSITGTLDFCQSQCASSINVVKDCTELSDADMWQDAWINDPTETSEFIGPDNITGCILNKSDDAGNSYYLSENNGGLDKNRYCKIYCKEDYSVLKFSGIQETYSGRYFKIGGHIEGAKSCYTASGDDPVTKTKNSIDKEKYIADLNDASKKLVDAYNEYIFYKSASSITSTSTDSSGTAPGGSGGSGPCTDPKTCKPVKADTRWSCTGESLSVTLYSKSWGFTMYDYQGIAHKIDSGGTYTAPDGMVYVGNYSSGTKVSCGTCTCTGSNGTNMDSSHASSYASALVKLNTAKSNYEAIISQYKNCTTNWENIFNSSYMPDIYYSYAEDYYNLYNNISEYKMNKSNTSNISKTEFCTGTINKNYECSKPTTNYVPTTTEYYLYCDETGGCYNKVEENIPIATYVKKTVKDTEEYTTPVKFDNIYTSGIITPTNPMLEQTTSVDGLPVALKTIKGAYQYKFIINKMGQLYNDNNGSKSSPILGRLVNSESKENSVISKINSKDEMIFNGEYVCYYTVNCPYCEVKCDENHSTCSWCVGTTCCDKGQDCTCPDCKSDCINCIYDLSSLQLNFRSISSTNINPNNRDLGYNWNVNVKNWSDSTTSYYLLGEKASNTIEEITTDGDKIYDQTPILTVNMTPAVASDIRSYNLKESTNGGYANDSLTCYDYSYNGITSKNIFCFSEFLDEMTTNSPSAFVFNNARKTLSDKNSRSNDSITANSINPNGYWQVYNKATTYAIGDLSNAGGLSWK